MITNTDFYNAVTSGNIDLVQNYLDKGFVPNENMATGRNSHYRYFSPLYLALYTSCLTPQAAGSSLDPLKAKEIINILLTQKIVGKSFDAFQATNAIQQFEKFDSTPSKPIKKKLSTFDWDDKDKNTESTYNKMRDLLNRIVNENSITPFILGSYDSGSPISLFPRDIIVLIAATVKSIP